MATKQIIVLPGSICAIVNYRDGSQARRGFPHYPGELNKKHATDKANQWADQKMREESGT